MLADLMQRLAGWLTESGMSAAMAERAATGVILFAGAVAAAIAYALVHFIVSRFVKSVAGRTKFAWDDALVNAGFVSRLEHVAPLTIIYWFGVSIFAGAPPFWFSALTEVYLLLIILGALSALLTAAQYIIDHSRAGVMPLKGMIQAIRLILYIIGAILLLSSLLNRSPVFFFSGLTALTAVMMLIFKDAILGFVAGVQISANQMVRIGDWIEMPQQGADGFVIDVSLTTVKVQNWDKTISTIPAYAMISESFKNWGGMFDSGGRRIKRSIRIDIQTISFADEQMLASWQKICLLRPYLTERLADIAAGNETLNEDERSILGNGRRLTNLGTFRAYCTAYLRANPEINQDMIFMIRQLQPTELGLPLEIYVFTRDTRWVEHERVQSDIFDHLLAIIPQFGLRVFQRK